MIDVMLDVAEDTGAERNAIRPFHASFSDADLADMRRRIKATRWPDRETVKDTSQGVPLAVMQQLATYWATDYDWRKGRSEAEGPAAIHDDIDGLDIHFIHVRSKHPNALPLIINHGWPGSIIEQLKLIDPFTEPHGTWRRAHRMRSMW